MVRSETVTPLHTVQKIQIKALKRYFLYTSTEVVKIPNEMYKIHVT
jgi:hypothetical protein